MGEGLERLCKDLEMEPNDQRILLFIFFCGRDCKMGLLTLQQFKAGCRALGTNVDSLKKLKAAIHALTITLDDQKFPDFHDFAFSFACVENKQTKLAIDDTCTMLRVVFGSGFSSSYHVERLLEFLPEQEETHVTRDQWNGFLRFVFEVAHDLCNLVEDDAWPTLLDSYVDWLRVQPAKQDAQQDAAEMDTA